MDSTFIVNHFQSRKWLKSMVVGEKRLLPVQTCSYQSIRATKGQLKAMGIGDWRVTKKGLGNAFTQVERIA